MGVANLYRKAFSGLTTHIWLLSTVMLVNRAGTMVLPFLTLYCTQQKHFTFNQAGWVVAMYGIGSVLGAFFGGKLTDRFGFYYVQLVSLLSGGIMFIILGQLESYSAICIGAFSVGVMNEAFRPANASAVGYYSTSQNRTQAFSLMRLAINVGWGIGTALGGILASFNYKLLFWVDGGTNILAAILLILILPREGRAAQSFSHTINHSQLSPYRDKHFLGFILLVLIFACCYFQLYVTVPLYMKEKLQLGENIYGIVTSLNGILIGLFEMVIVYKLEGRRNYLVLMCIGAFIMGFSFFLFNAAAISPIFICTLIVVLITLAEMIAVPFMSSWYIGRANENNRGQYAAVYTIAWSAAQIIGSTLGAQAASKIGFTVFWWVLGAFSLISSTGFVLSILLTKKNNCKNGTFF